MDALVLTAKRTPRLHGASQRGGRAQRDAYRPSHHALEADRWLPQVEFRAFEGVEAEVSHTEWTVVRPIGRRVEWRIERMPIAALALFAEQREAVVTGWRVASAHACRQILERDAPRTRRAEPDPNRTFGPSCTGARRSRRGRCEVRPAAPWGKPVLADWPDRVRAKAVRLLCRLFGGMAPKICPNPASARDWSVEKLSCLGADGSRRADRASSAAPPGDATGAHIRSASVTFCC